METGLPNSAARPRFLMCRPQYYAVSYSINPWMDPQGWAAEGSDLGEAAHREWAALHAALLDKGATIECVDPRPDLPDLVFTANAAIVLDGKALLSRFRHLERKPEEPVFADAFQTLRAQADLDSVEALPGDMIQEGAGDCIWDPYRGQFWMGHGTRSDHAAAEVVADYFGVECVGLELADPSFYHLDTAFCALPTGDVIYYPQAFTAVALGAIEERVEPTQRIALDRAEAAQFSANAVSFDHCLVLSSCTDTLRSQDRGARLHRARHAAACVPAERRLGLLPHASSRPPLGERRNLIFEARRLVERELLRAIGADRMLLLGRAPDGGGRKASSVQCAEEGLTTRIIARDVSRVDGTADVKRPVRLPAGVDVAEACRVRVAQHPLHAGIDELHLLLRQADPWIGLDPGMKLRRRRRVPGTPSQQNYQNQP